MNRLYPLIFMPRARRFHGVRASASSPRHSFTASAKRERRSRCLTERGL
ncbi:MAG: hypothetical protein KBA61_18045 [Spirochaetes bacterium]|nr:hypothetical protein [Spirochaetota bacterium]